MRGGKLIRLAMTVAIGMALAATSLASAADPHSKGANDHGAETKQQKQDDKDDKHSKKASQQLSHEQQQKRIERQREALAEYRENMAQQNAIAERYAQQLEQQRAAHRRFQQAYYERLRQQQAQLADNRYDFDNDPFYYTAPSYRYTRAGQDYETNQYGAESLRKALNYGYQEGLQAGRADMQDNWAFADRQSFAYEDANYGYDGRYVQQADYNHFFREGFQRGYDDGYYERRQYGSSVNGSDSLLGAILETILNLQALR